jgi:hypothetical protein
MAKKDFFNGTYVSYTRWNVQWASTSILLLLRNNKVSLARTLHTYDGIFLRFLFSQLILNQTNKPLVQSRIGDGLVHKITIKSLLCQQKCS